ncbi:MAG: hypothetical protein R2690_04770 [Acidimicrobiales bacterium]
MPSNEVTSRSDALPGTAVASGGSVGGRSHGGGAQSTSDVADVPGGDPVAISVPRGAVGAAVSPSPAGEQAATTPASTTTSQVRCARPGRRVEGIDR